MRALGYERTATYEVQRRMSLGRTAISEPSPIPGYILRDIDPDDRDDCRRVADLLNAAFDRDFHTAEEVMVFFSHAPCFRRGLDVVAEAPEGSFAAYVGVAYVEENQYGVFEPVCTHPDHVRKGLARSLMLRGLNRLRAHDATSVFVGAGDQEAANRLYDSIGFTEAYRKYMWQLVV
jgi:predicted N-acetyltransferase YhbS